MFNQIRLKIIAWLWIVLAGAGLADAVYLTLKRYSGTSLDCLIGDGCNIVAKSQYSVVAGVPLSLIGAMFFVTMIVMAIGYLITKQSPLLIVGGWLAIPGMFIAWWYEYMQFYVIYSICIYCVVMAVISTLLCLSGLWLIWHERDIDRRGWRKFWFK